MPNIPPGLPSALLERRPDVAYAERQLAASNARIGVAVAAFFPVVRLTGAAGFESADLGTLFDWQSRIWQLGPSISLPIFEGGRNVANLREAQARYQQQVDAYRKQVLVAFQDVENSLGDLHTLSDQADAQERAVASALRALQLSQQQYTKGTNNFLDVLDAERTLLLDERTSVELFGQRLQATVQLIKALGGSWSWHTAPRTDRTPRSPRHGVTCEQLALEFRDPLHHIPLLLRRQLREDRQRHRLPGRAFALREISFLVTQARQSSPADAAPPGNKSHARFACSPDAPAAHPAAARE